MHEIISSNKVYEKIYLVRGVYVMLDSELAHIYKVETKVFNQAVKRNIDRFPEEFRFQLTENEFLNLRSQIVTSRVEHGGRRYLPYVFTEQGVAMLSAVLKSNTAIKTSIQVINAFVEMRKYYASHGDLFQKLQHIEKKQISFELEARNKFEEIFSALESKDLNPTQGVFYNGEIFDAYLFFSKLIRSAKKSIILLDNYIDETVLEHLTKCGKRVKIYILTGNITNKLKLDLDKFNKQYSKIETIRFNLSHDRFMVIDERDVYHIGASLKDLGKKWFAFSKLEKESFGFMSQIEKIINS